MSTFKNCKTNLLVATIDYVLPFLMNGIAFGLLMDAVVSERFDQGFGFLIVWAFFAFLTPTGLLRLCWRRRRCSCSWSCSWLCGSPVVLMIIFVIVLFYIYWSFTWGVASLVSLEVEVGNVSSGCVIFRSLSSKVPWSDITIDFFR